MWRGCSKLDKANTVVQVLKRKTKYTAQERPVPPNGQCPHREGTAGSNYLSFVKVAYNGLIECLLQLPMGLGVLLARLHDLGCTLLI